MEDKRYVLAEGDFYLWMREKKKKKGRALWPHKDEVERLNLCPLSLPSATKVVRMGDGF